MHGVAVSHVPPALLLDQLVDGRNACGHVLEKDIASSVLLGMSKFWRPSRKALPWMLACWRTCAAVMEEIIEQTDPYDTTLTLKDRFSSPLSFLSARLSLGLGPVAREWAFAGDMLDVHAVQFLRAVQPHEAGKWDTFPVDLDDPSRAVDLLYTLVAQEEVDALVHGIGPVPHAPDLGLVQLAMNGEIQPVGAGRRGLCLVPSCVAEVAAGARRALGAPFVERLRNVPPCFF